MPCGGTDRAPLCQRKKYRRHPTSTARPVQFFLLGFLRRFRIQVAPLLILPLADQEHTAMPTNLMTLLAFTSIAALSMTAEAQEISRTAPVGKHPYDVALEYSAPASIWSAPE